MAPVSADDVMGIRVIIIPAVFSAFAIVAVTGRIWARHIRKTDLQLNDHLAVIALVFTLGLNATVMTGAISGGVGQHMPSLTLSEGLILGKTFLAAGVLWASAIAFVKLSLLNFYLKNSKKISLMFIFGLGALVCIISILRIVAIENLDPLDMSYTSAADGIYSSLGRQSLGIVAACLPIMQPVFAKMSNITTTVLSRVKGSGQRSLRASSKPLPDHDERPLNKRKAEDRMYPLSNYAETKNEIEGDCRRSDPEAAMSKYEREPGSHGRMIKKTSEFTFVWKAMFLSTARLANSYDYVIVGGGTSGLTVANRLSENPGLQILVLEAGYDHLDDPRVTIPALCMQTHGSDLDWQFVTTPQKELKDRKIRHPQGRLLGGSSGINNQSFICPSSSAIDAWAELGNDGWEWANMEPYYRKFYTLNVPDTETCRHLGLDYITDTDKEAGGPVQVSYIGSSQDPLSKAWVDTFKGLKHGLTGNPYSCKSMGGYANAATVDPSSKTRSYAVTAYYAPVAQRIGLFVLTGAEVERIDFIEGNGDKVANAVVFTCEGKSWTVGVQKEVIVAAGTFQSPKILELSGIGNPTMLQSLDIKVVVGNENVGENLQDHLLTGISFEVNEGVMTGDSLMRQDPEAIAAATDLFQSHKAGPLTVGGVASHAFMPTGTPDPGPKMGSELLELLQQHPVDPKYEHQHKTIRKMLEAQAEGTGALFMFLAQTNLHNDESAKDYLQNLQAGNFISLGACQTYVFSSGSSHLVSSDSSDPPKIDPRYLSHPLDLELLARHVQFLERLARSPPLSDYIKPNGKRNHPTAYVEDLDAAKEYVRTTAFSSYHPAGTCAMLPRNKGGVVNNRLVVYGTKNVRVVDASIMPLIPRSNLQSTVYAVAERAADLIKADT
ncbi:MAG: hypothetical protein Q9181_006265 [Wetmoreana brouardii]